MSINSRNKGKRGERAWRDELRAAGWMSARRGQQFAGSPDSPDVVCEELGFIHHEVKHSERGNPFAFMAQAERDAGAGKIPVVAMRRNLHPFLVLMRAPDYFALLRCCDLAELQRNTEGATGEVRKAG